jgi:hypothetical protein
LSDEDTFHDIFRTFPVNFQDISVTRKIVVIPELFKIS